MGLWGDLSYYFGGVGNRLMIKVVIILKILLYQKKGRRKENQITTN